MLVLVMANDPLLLLVQWKLLLVLEVLLRLVVVLVVVLAEVLLLEEMSRVVVQVLLRQVACVLATLGRAHGPGRRYSGGGYSWPCCCCCYCGWRAGRAWPSARSAGRWTSAASAHQRKLAQGARLCGQVSLDGRTVARLGWRAAGRRARSAGAGRAWRGGGHHAALLLLLLHASVLKPVPFGGGCDLFVFVSKLISRKRSLRQGCPKPEWNFNAV